ncbi:hypothetical protein ENUP19_0186G0004 [Entamoeba nuttalli]|uniref:RBR-type E3 ubiquitin transferase n=2 Tax=Entamoeba nuttalli TaxID=412467 RepID=K2HDH7_ENTNP|nr:IBR domain containing protein [Entamoeba nuttalli P19]EKE40854.1 IBR domain containing protein [Entamoeba nuttalli P19]|eukprot:XP_008856812.1 IBR domain containing protein [Entamoeba nuttalli P19]
MEDTRTMLYEIYKQEYIESIQRLIKRKEKEEEETKELMKKEQKEREEEIEKKEYTCDICYSDIQIQDMYIFDCGHKFCLDCCYEHIHEKIFNGIVKVRCPKSMCCHDITFEEIYQIIRRHQPIDQELIERYERFSIQEYLKKEKNCRYCPRCGTGVIGDPNTPEIECQNEECKKKKIKFCFNCKEIWHEGLTCSQYQEWKRMNCEADKRFLSWAQKNTRKCPKCNATIEKNRGCNHMTCANCGYQFCWLCMQEYTSSHFKNGKCKQYS